MGRQARVRGHVFGPVRTSTPWRNCEGAHRREHGRPGALCHKQGLGEERRERRRTHLMRDRKESSSRSGEKTSKGSGGQREGRRPLLGLAARDPDGKFLANGAESASTACCSGLVTGAKSDSCTYCACLRSWRRWSRRTTSSTTRPPALDRARPIGLGRALSETPNVAA